MKEIMIKKKQQISGDAELSRRKLGLISRTCTTQPSPSPLPPPRLAVGRGEDGQGGGALREWVGTDAVTEGTESFFFFCL